MTEKIPFHKNRLIVDCMTSGSFDSQSMTAMKQQLPVCGLSAREGLTQKLFFIFLIVVSLLFFVFANPTFSEEQYPTIKVSFLGTSEDKVGSGFQTHPNGESDGCFRITIKTGGEILQVTGIWIYTSDARGNQVSSNRRAQWWSTTGKGWILGVERDNERINQWERKVDDVISGDIEYHVFADGAKWFKRPGQYFTIGVEFANGSVLSYIIRTGVAGELH
ncbi:MAG: hypothetical protein HOI47_06770 [Candidatus Scalindua sp.]|nr:hypothetical protein [Candidatus Scalindua sp.]MBT6226341.1 hypothetical protein [Candidatus Scalindua sp.]